MKQRISAAVLAMVAGTASVGSFLAAVRPAAAQPPQDRAYRGGSAGNWSRVGQRDRGNRVTGRTGNNSLEATLATDRNQYGEQRAVEIRLTQENLQDRNQSLIVPGGSAYEITIRDDRSGRVVWNRRDTARDRPYYTPGEIKRWQTLWDQRDDRGNLVPRGLYTVEARVYPQRPLSVQIALLDRDGRGENGRPGDDRPGNNRPDDYGSLSSQLVTRDQRVRPGDTASFVFTVTNFGRDSQTVRFSSGQQFDMEAVRTDDTGRGGFGRGRRAFPIWRLSDGQMSTQALTEITLRPGQRLTFTGRWQMDRNVAPGTYQVTAFLTPVRGGRTAEATTQIVVSDGFRR